MNKAEEYVKDTTRLIEDALNKQIPTEPIDYEDKYYGCPRCQNVLLTKWERYPDVLTPKSEGLKYCLNCGQALDWKTEEITTERALDVINEFRGTINIHSLDGTINYNTYKEYNERLSQIKEIVLRLENGEEQ